MDHAAVIQDYYRCFRERDLEGLRRILTPDFHHVSSFGEHFDRDQMLAEIWPAVGRSWAEEPQIFGEAPEFMVRYRIESTERRGASMAEYVRFQDGLIAEIEVYLGREHP